MIANPRLPEFQQRLAECHAASLQLRLLAFVDYAPVVCGLALRPITLRTYTLLLAWQNPFVCGGPVDLKAIVQFVWLHHPRFAQFAERDRRRVARRIHRSLTPRLPTLNACAHFLLPIFSALAAPSASKKIVFGPLAFICRRLRRPTAADRMQAAVAEIRRLVHEALHDFPSGAEDAPPSPYALEPHLVSVIARGYAINLVDARRIVAELPLKQLFEYVREILHRLSGGKDKLMTRAEAQVWADYLDYRNPPADSAALNSQPSSLS